MSEGNTYNIYHTTREAWDAMLMAMRGATSSIFWEMYILVDDDVGNQFFDILKAKAREGVDVKLVIDYWGSFWLSGKKITELQQAGIDIRLFQQKRNPFRGFKEWFMRRTHRKMLIIDERIGFVGGVNVQKNMEAWDDLMVEFSGTPVHSLLRSFARSYLMCGGKRSHVKRFLTYRYRVAHQDLSIVYDNIGRRHSRIRNIYLKSIHKARERVILFSPYYFPDRSFLKALYMARKRGVRVDLLIPFRTDVRIATYAAYAWFSLMSKVGIRIHLTKNMMHGKGMLVDDDFAFFGSSNLDYPSFQYNQEMNVGMKDKRAVARIKQVLETWISRADELDDRRWKRRGSIAKMKERIARWLYVFWFRVKK